MSADFVHTGVTRGPVMQCEHQSPSGDEHDAAEHFARVHATVGVRGGVERHDVMHDCVDLPPDGSGELLRPDACQFRSGNGAQAQRAEGDRALERADDRARLRELCGCAVPSRVLTDTSWSERRPAAGHCPAGVYGKHLSRGCNHSARQERGTAGGTGKDGHGKAKRRQAHQAHEHARQGAPGLHVPVLCVDEGRHDADRNGERRQEPGPVRTQCA